MIYTHYQLFFLFYRKKDCVCVLLFCLSLSLYRISHPFPPDFFADLLVLAIRTDRMASSKTFLRPFWVSAEHSRYFWATSWLASCAPLASDMGSRCLSRRRLSCSGSSRKSILVPTRRNGTPGAWCEISGYHFDLTFSYDEGEITEKQTKNTSV